METRVQLISQKVTTNEEIQLKFASQVTSDDHENKEHIRDLSSKLDIISKWKLLAMENNTVRLSIFSIELTFDLHSF